MDLGFDHATMPSSARPARRVSESKCLPSSENSNADKDASSALREPSVRTITGGPRAAPSSVRRRAQNRIAQRTFRLRHAAHVRSLEAKSHMLAECQAELVQCKQRIAILETLAKRQLACVSKQRDASETCDRSGGAAEWNRRNTVHLPYDKQTGDLLEKIQNYTTTANGDLKQRISPALRACSADPFMPHAASEHCITSCTLIGDNCQHCHSARDKFEPATNQRKSL